MKNNQFGSTITFDDIANLHGMKIATQLLSVLELVTGRSGKEILIDKNERYRRAVLATLEINFAELCDL